MFNIKSSSVWSLTLLFLCVECECTAVLVSISWDFNVLCIASFQFLFFVLCRSVGFRVCVCECVSMYLLLIACTVTRVYLFGWFECSVCAARYQRSLACSLSHTFTCSYAHIHTHPNTHITFFRLYKWIGNHWISSFAAFETIGCLAQRPRIVTLFICLSDVFFPFLQFFLNVFWSGVV